MQPSTRQVAYALLAAVGVVATWTFNLKFAAEAGGTFSAIEFVRAGYANSASASLSNDLLVGVAAFLVWSFAEARRLRMRRWWVYPIVTFGVAFACAFPLFLLFRERRLEQLSGAGTVRA